MPISLIPINNVCLPTNGGGFLGVLTFEDISPNTVEITADISDPINSGLTKGDILGLWFDFADFTMLGGFPSFGGSTAVLGFAYGDNFVGNSLGGPVNINGSGPADWDLGVQVGKNGTAGGFFIR